MANISRVISHRELATTISYSPTLFVSRQFNPDNLSCFSLDLIRPSFHQDLSRAGQAAEKLSAELERSRASETEALRALAAATAAADADASAKADRDAARARESSAVSRLREIEAAAARGREEMEGAKKACEKLRERVSAAEEEARRESGRGRAKVAEVIARKDKAVGWVGVRRAGRCA